MLISSTRKRVCQFWVAYILKHIHVYWDLLALKTLQALAFCLVGTLSLQLATSPKELIIIYNSRIHCARLFTPRQWDATRWVSVLSLNQIFGPQSIAVIGSYRASVSLWTQTNTMTLFLSKFIILCLRIRQVYISIWCWSHSYCRDATGDLYNVGIRTKIKWFTRIY